MRFAMSSRRLAEPGWPRGATGPGAGSASVAGSPVPDGRWVDIPPYQGDALVRGSEALAKTKDGRLARDVI